MSPQFSRGLISLLPGCARECAGDLTLCETRGVSGGKYVECGSDLGSVSPCVPEHPRLTPSSGTMLVQMTRDGMMITRIMFEKSRNIALRLQLQKLNLILSLQIRTKKFSFCNSEDLIINPGSSQLNDICQSFEIMKLLTDWWCVRVRASKPIHGCMTISFVCP